MPGDSKETVIFRGNSHNDSDGKGRTGIGVTYGNSPVEVERGEPMFEMQDGGQIDPSTGEPNTSGIVLGNLKFNKNLAKTIGDPTLLQIADKYGDSKYRNIGSDIAKKTANINTKMQKIVNKTNNLKPALTSFDEIENKSLELMEKGLNMQLKDFAKQNIVLANFQQAHNDVAENKYDADALARGKVEYAKLGTSLSKAQKGKIIDRTITQDDYNTLMQLYTEAEKVGNGPQVKTFQNSAANILDMNVNEAKKFIDGVMGPKTRAIKPMLDEALKTWKTKNTTSAQTTQLGYEPPTYPWVTDPNQKADQLEEITDVPASKATTVAAATPKKPGFDWMTMFNNMMPYLRPSDSDTLDPRQLAGEMYALSNNQQEPVYAQTVNPQLTVPYDVSLQDILNENTAASRAAQRTMGYNPAAQANIAAQQYAANQKVLGEQFRMNQDMKNKTYAQNRQILDQAQATNLGIFAQQSDKQAQAKSNTKMQTQAALQSISAKFLENQSKNKELKTYENLYNYRFGKDQIADNWNPLAQFNMSGSNTGKTSVPGFNAVYEVDGETGQSKVMRYVPKTKKETEESAKNGTLVKLFK